MDEREVNCVILCNQAVIMTVLAELIGDTNTEIFAKLEQMTATTINVAERLANKGDIKNDS